MKDVIEAIKEEELNLWWESFQQQLQALGLDPKNPAVLSNILVNNNIPQPVDDNGNEYDFTYIPFRNNPESFREHVNKRKELMNAFSYGFMEKKNGKYVVPRPEKGVTVNWMFDNLKDFEHASRQMKEHLFRMAKENRLLLRDAKPNEGYGRVRFIKTDGNGKAFITSNFAEMLKLNPQEKEAMTASMGFTQEEYQKTEKMTLDALNMYTKLEHSDRALGFLYDDINSGKIPVTDICIEDESRNRFRAASWQNNEIIEHFASYFEISNPTWNFTSEYRSQIDLVYRCAAIPAPFRLSSEDLLREEFSEINTLQKKYEKNILKFTNCNNLKDVISSEKIKHLDGTPFTEKKIIPFTRQYMKAINNYEEPGLLLTLPDGKQQIYTPNADLGLEPGIHWSGFEKTFQKINEGLSTQFLKETIEESIAYNRALQSIDPTTAPKLSPEAQFDEMFRVMQRKMADREGAALIPIGTMEKPLENLNEAAKNYLSLPDIKSGSDLTPAQKERKEMAALCVEFCTHFMDHDEQVYEHMAQSHSELFSMQSLPTAEAPAKKAIPTPVSISAYSAEFSRLYEDLQKTDSVLSNDSKEYDSLMANLYVLTKTGFDSMPLDKCFSNEMEDLANNVNNACKSYMESHSELDKLSDRQQRRLKAMHRIMDLTDNIRKGVSDPRDDKIEMVAGKLVQNQLIQACRKGVASVSMISGRKVAPKEILTDHEKMKMAVNALKKSPAFTDFCKNKDLQKLLKTNGERLTKNYSTFIKERSLTHEKKQPVQNSSILR